ncbi:hypothetical protein CYMTET_15263 [Cymbomonas tetramitiformis]|uniref:Uncharacterized protein n=1 Tax=Cymbomonas tetramitiformis TaxID=36881 RepID=A0AAE0GEB9_9CHLO|nr:hypothetical protein CYMTET_15263 [Cymbomonas tetramitiformis]
MGHVQSSALASCTSSSKKGSVIVIVDVQSYVLEAEFSTAMEGEGHAAGNTSAPSSVELWFMQQVMRDLSELRAVAAASDSKMKSMEADMDRLRRVSDRTSIVIYLQGATIIGGALFAAGYAYSRLQARIS